MLLKDIGFGKKFRHKEDVWTRYGIEDESNPQGIICLEHGSNSRWVISEDTEVEEVVRISDLCHGDRFCFDSMDEALTYRIVIVPDEGMFYIGGYSADLIRVHNPMREVVRLGTRIADLRDKDRFVENGTIFVVREIEGKMYVRKEEDDWSWCERLDSWNQEEKVSTTPVVAGMSGSVLAEDKGGAEVAILGKALISGLKDGDVFRVNGLIGKVHEIDGEMFYRLKNNHVIWAVATHWVYDNLVEVICET